jgi:hypothetical protein
MDKSTESIHVQVFGFGGFGRDRFQIIQVNIWFIFESMLVL